MDTAPGVPGFAELPDHLIVAAATACVSEADFRKRLRSPAPAVSAPPS